LRSFAIRHFPGVVAEIKLTQVSVKMLATYVMIDSVYSALESRKVAFDRIRANAYAFVIADIFVSRMIDQGMLASGVLVPKDTRISHEMGIRFANIVQHRREIVGGYTLNMP